MNNKLLNYTKHIVMRIISFTEKNKKIKLKFGQIRIHYYQKRIRLKMKQTRTLISSHLEFDFLDVHGVSTECS